MQIVPFKKNVGCDGDIYLTKTEFSSNLFEQNRLNDLNILIHKINEIVLETHGGKIISNVQQHLRYKSSVKQV